MSPTARTAKPKPERPWQRAEAGEYRSSDGRFTIRSEGPSRWFITDTDQQDELGLPRTLGPFATLDDAKSRADAHRDESVPFSPLAGRIATDGTKGGASPGRSRTAARATPPPPPEPPPKTWLDKLADEDRDAARRARRLISALEDEGIADAEALVRRDITGNQPVVAARLLARDILEAVGDASKPQSVVEAVLEAFVSSRARKSLPGWELVERDGPTDQDRVIRLVPDDLRAAAREARSRR